MSKNSHQRNTPRIQNDSSQPHTTFWKWQVCLTDRPHGSADFAKRIQITSCGVFCRLLNFRDTGMNCPFEASAATKEELMKKSLNTQTKFTT